MNPQRSPNSQDSNRSPQSSQSQSGSQDKSSSSNAPSSGSTNHSLSSYSSGMDTAPITQELPDTIPIGSDDEKDEAAWGRLFPIRSPPFSKLYLVRDEYTFGRDDDLSDVSLNTDSHKSTFFFKAYSKIHFKIERRHTSTGIHVFLEDCSSNGTFINGSKVGRGNQQVLKQFDEIALAHTGNKAFIYQDLLQKEEEGELPKEISDYYLLTKVLGKGAYGEVRLAFEKGTANPRKIAVKILSNKKLTMRGRNLCDGTSDIRREVEIMKKIEHPCIVKVFDVFETENKTFILMELVEGGELFDRVLKVNSFPEQTAKLLFYQMLLAVEHLHKAGIVHRDLKPENILLSDPESDETLIKVADFGVSKLLDANTMMKTLCGTPTYLAPEVLQSQTMGQYDNKVDCWSLGVILFICLSGCPPFPNDRGDLPLEEQIKKRGSIIFQPADWKDISKPAVDMVKHMLTVDAKARPTVSEALQHSWLDDADMRSKAEKLMNPGGTFVAPLAPKKRPRDGGDAATSPPTKAPLVSEHCARKGSPEKPSSPKKSPKKKV